MNIERKKITINDLKRAYADKDGKAFINKNGKAYSRLNIQDQHGVWYSDFGNQKNEYWRIGDELTIDFKVNNSGGKTYRNLVWPDRSNNYGRDVESINTQEYGSPTAVQPKQETPQQPVGARHILEKVELLRADINAVHNLLNRFLNTPAIKNLVSQTENTSAQDEFNRKAAEIADFDSDDSMPF